jgi:hypothetical protein
VLLLALACAAATGCKQKSKEEPEPTAAPSASVAPAATAEAPPPAETIPPPPTPPSIPAAASAKGGGGSGESIKACCAALHKEADGAPPDKKANLQSVAGTCDAINKLVTAGTTKKAAALTSLRASMRGAPLPAGCN